jgi:acetoin utilization deacetylase AcuC-like enzyme
MFKRATGHRGAVTMNRSSGVPTLFLALSLHKALPAISFAAIPVLFDSTNHWHRDLQYHPEQPDRIAVCIRALEDLRRNDPCLVELIDVAADRSASIPHNEQATHIPVTEDELAHAKDMLLQVHASDLVLRLEERCNQSKQKRIEDGKPTLGHMGNIDGDTYLTTETFEVCLRATVAWIRAADDRNGAAMALMRPPGHHATRTMQNGFCLFNFAAATAAHILGKEPTRKVSIIDWDVHYGQGVADIVENQERVRYVSIHQTPAFPYMGEKLKVQGPHKNILTIPMPADTTWTCGYEALFDKALEFACERGEWEPDVVIICAGYDALGSDELAGVSLNAEDYGRMTRKLIQHLQFSTSKRPSLVFGLEGGYQLSPSASGGSLQDAVVETVLALAENYNVVKSVA